MQHIIIKSLIEIAFKRQLKTSKGTFARDSASKIVTFVWQHSQKPAHNHRGTEKLTTNYQRRSSQDKSIHNEILKML